MGWKSTLRVRSGSGRERDDACYSVGDDTMCGVVKPKAGINASLAAIESCEGPARRRRGSAYCGSVT